jgi:hypothetical protein
MWLGAKSMSAEFPDITGQKTTFRETEEELKI